MKELKFKGKLVKDLRADGLYVVPVEMIYCPGFPDLLVAKDNKVVVIETKVIKRWPLTAMQTRRVFKADQLVFYKRWLAKGNRVFLAAVFEKPGDKFFWAEIKAVVDNLVEVDGEVWLETSRDIVTRIEEVLHVKP